MAARTLKRAAGPVAFLTLIAGLIALCLVFPGQAHAQALGTIEGNVTAVDTGLPMSGVIVKAYDTFGAEQGTTATEADGDYSIMLIAGTYRLYFLPQDSYHAPIYYQDANDFITASGIALSEGATVVGVDQACPVGGQIEGTVLDETTQDPLDPAKSHVEVYKSYTYNHSEEVTMVSDDVPLDPVTGAYTVTGLAECPYYVVVASDDGYHAAQWWYENVASRTAALKIPVLLDEVVSGVDVDVPAGGMISGMATDTSGAPVPDTGLNAYMYDAAKQTWTVTGSGSADENGLYSMGPVPAGTYKLQCMPPANQEFVECWYNTSHEVRRANLSQGDTFTVVALQTSDIDGVLWRTGTVSGVVLTDDAHRGPIENVMVKPYIKNGDRWDEVSSKIVPTQGMFYVDPISKMVQYDPANWGHFTIEFLAPGTYKFEFAPVRPMWKGQWFSNATTITNATQVVLEESTVRNDVNALLDWNDSALKPYASNSSEFSDYGKILAELSLPYNEISNDCSSSFDILNPCLLAKYDKIFLNCSSTFRMTYEQKLGETGIWNQMDPNNTPLAQWVRGGKQLFLSDITGNVMSGAFQDPILFSDRSEQIITQNITASVTDAGLRGVLGSSTAAVKFDKDGTEVISALAGGAIVEMRGNLKTDVGTTVSSSPICVSIPYGNGLIEYQNFHIDKQATQFRKDLLTYLMGGGSIGPRINSLSAVTGSIGSEITINGANFGSTRGSSTVKFNTATATSYASWSASQIKVKVPAGATTGQVKVITEQGTSNGVTFTVVNGGSPTTWYLAEGTSDWGFETYVTIENPNTKACTANITYFTPNGQVKRNPITLPPTSQVTINPANDLGPPTDFSTKVVCPEGYPIAVDRRMTWTGQGALSQEGHASIGVTYSSKSWYLAEGSSNWGFECYLLVQNPNNVSTDLSVTYMIEGSGPVTKTRSVPANSRTSWNMAEDIGQKDASIKITSTQNVIAERSMYRNNRREGHESIGTAGPSSTYYLAEGTTGYGFTTYVLVQNPNSVASNVTVTYMTAKGAKAQPVFSLPANSRKTIKVNDVSGMVNQDFSTKVQGSQPIIAERAMYWSTASGEACHDSVGMDAPHLAFYLPDGQTINGYETWTCVQNPNSSVANITIKYLPENGVGGPRTMTDTIPANSRKTYDMFQLVNGKASIYVGCTNGKKIMVERSMYWSARGAGTNTIGGYSD